MRVFLYSHEAYQYTAWSIQAGLVAKGHEVFVFIDTKQVIPVQNLQAADYLLMIAPPFSFSQCYEPNNGTRRLLEAVVATKLPIIPLCFFEDSFASPHYKRYIHESIAFIRQLKPLQMDFADWDSTIDSLHLSLSPLEKFPNGDFTASELPNKQNLANGRKAEMIYERGNYYYLEKAYEQAKACFDEALTLWPEYASAYNSRALAKSYLKARDDAITDMTEAIRLRPDEEVFWSNRSLLYNELKRYSEAIDDASKALELNSELSSAHNNRAIAYSSLNSYENALKDHNQAIKLDSNSSTLYANRAYLLKNMNRIGEALEDFNRAIELDSENAFAHQERASIYNEQGMLELALTDYEKAIALTISNETLSVLYGDRARVYYRIHQYDAFMRDTDKAIGLNPQHSMVYANRGIVHTELGDYDKGLADFNQAIELDAENAHAYAHRGLLKMQMGKKEASLQDINQAIAINDSEASFYAIRANYYIANMNSSAAMKDLNKSIDLEPASNTYLSRARLYLHSSPFNKAKARNDYMSALEFDHKNKQAQDELDRLNMSFWAWLKELIFGD